jgi:hypothetical protein
MVKDLEGSEIGASIRGRARSFENYNFPDVSKHEAVEMEDLNPLYYF